MLKGMVEFSYKYITKVLARFLENRDLKVRF